MKRGCPAVLGDPDVCAVADQEIYYLRLAGLARVKQRRRTAKTTRVDVRT